MDLQSLKNTSLELIIEAFRDAFDDYEIQLNEKELSSMLKRRGYVPELSFAAFDEGKIVAFTLNGIGNYNGVPTVYDIGTGTIKKFRGKGLATEIFEHPIPYLKDNNLKQYLLEVLQHNTKAVSVYRKLKFKVNRELNYFFQKSDKVDLCLKNLNSPYRIQQTELSNIYFIPEFWDFYPSWQNSFDSILRSPDDFKVIGAFEDNRLIGYCILEPYSGDIAQIAVAENCRRNGVASSLLRKAIALNLNDSIKIINTDIKCLSITKFFESKNIHVTGRQFEMIKQL